MIRTLYWKNGAVVLIDQNALPLTERYITCRNYREVIAAIKNLTVRGAPAIGVAAAMAAALGAAQLAALPPEIFRSKFYTICTEISRARPTARNLCWALERMKKCLTETFRTGKKNPVPALISEAKRICAEDIAINRQIGQHGSVLLDNGDNILTHCNAGALATAGYGTALGVVRAAKKEGKKLHIYIDETRPVLQGARLTAWEMHRDKIPATLICDNMAASLMRQGKIDKIIVGADRIAANGDTANKIGTYALAVLARAHGIPFYVAAPLSTFDFSLKSGAVIPIEQRPGNEVSSWCGVQTTPTGMKVYNPAFDVTPAKFITAIITENGIITRPFGRAIARLHKEKRGI
jgi:methylthioribose-1-phosphate isomerase